MQLTSSQDHKPRKNNRKVLNQEELLPVSSSNFSEPSLKRPKITSVQIDSVAVESTEYQPTHVSLNTTDARTFISDQPLISCSIPSSHSFIPAPVVVPEASASSVPDSTQSKSNSEFLLAQEDVPKTVVTSIPDSTHNKSNSEPVIQDSISDILEPARDIKETRKISIMYITALIIGLLGLVFSQAGSVPVMRSVSTVSNTTNVTQVKNDTSTSLDISNNTDYEEFVTAISENNITVVTALLTKDPSLANIPDVNGWLPIHEAASGGHVEIVQALLNQSKENINARTTTGGSVLYWALEGQANHDYDHPMIQELIKNGAINYPPDQPVAPGTTVSLEIIANFNTAAAENDVELLGKILAEHPDVINHSDLNGYQALHEAAQYGHTEAVEFLLDHGASISTRVGTDFNGPTALYLALDNGFESDHPAVVALWNAGAVPLAEGYIFTDIAPEFTNVGFAPQDMAEAVRSGDCELLAEYAAERPNWLRIIDENGWLPLHEAAILGHIECVDVIMDAIGESDFINVRVYGTGGSALFYAKQELGEESPMIEHLISLGAEELEPIPDEL